MKVSRAELEAHVQKWAAAPVHAGTPWIPKFVYHFTDLQNVVSILKEQRLLCGNEAVRSKVMRHENASGEVIAATNQAHLDFVRLYFRPRTPTQFHNEGIRPPSRRGLSGAHCPVPVFLAFDLVETILLDGVMFSDGNMASQQVEYGDASSFFARIPFESVYHEGSIEEQRKRSIVFHRHAEVLAPKRLGLGTLRWIGCRTHAERESLLSLLADTRATWESKISVGERLFYRRDSAFVESATLDGNNVAQFRLHIPAAWPLRVKFEAVAASGRRWHWESDAWTSSTLALRMSGLEPAQMKLFIEDCLAYVGWAQPADLPF